MLSCNPAHATAILTPLRPVPLFLETLLLFILMSFLVPVFLRFLLVFVLFFKLKSSFRRWWRLLLFIFLFPLTSNLYFAVMLPSRAFHVDCLFFMLSMTLSGSSLYP